MVGVYDYTVVLTYFSLASAVTGIFVYLSGPGHPVLGSLFLLLCGLFDAFDGRVARRKKDRTELERQFGIQIDSLTDLVAFGVLPACIGIALMRYSPVIASLRAASSIWPRIGLIGLLYAVLVLYILAALIRLAFFNVAEEVYQSREGHHRTFYTGLPVTSACLIFPFILLLQYITTADISLIYFGTALLVGFGFLAKFRIQKPGLRGILLMIGIGALEFALALVGKLLRL